MRLITYAVPVLVLLLSFFYNTNPFIVKEEARQAFEYLSANKTALHWNDTLAKVAEAKALDMARRNYSGHIDPDGYGINHHIQQSGYVLDSCFESLSVGLASGEEAVRGKVLPRWGKDIGIGFVKCDVGKYRSYTCIIIAKHN